MSNANFNRGPAYGLSAEVKNKLAQKYDPQTERQLRVWIEGATGRRIGDNFMDGLKDGVILCELINKLQPGSVQKVNDPVQNWHKSPVLISLAAGEHWELPAGHQTLRSETPRHL